jgi:H+/gluconate symporter-like permease
MESLFCSIVQIEIKLLLMKMNVVVSTLFGHHFKLLTDDVDSFSPFNKKIIINLLILLNILGFLSNILSTSSLSYV